MCGDSGRATRALVSAIGAPMLLESSERERFLDNAPVPPKAALVPWTCWCAFASDFRIRGCCHVSRTSEVGHWSAATRGKPDPPAFHASSMAKHDYRKD